MHESARIYDVRMAQFVLKIEKLSHIIGARGSQDLRSPSPIMAPVFTQGLTYYIYLLAIIDCLFAYMYLTHYFSRCAANLSMICCSVRIESLKIVHSMISRS